MSQKQRSNKEIMMLILFTAVVCLGVLNAGTVAAFAKSFIGMLKPFMIGAAIAFVVNLPMKYIEEKWLKSLPEKISSSKRTIGIILSLLPAVRMADGSKLFIFQLIGNEAFFHMEKIANEPSVFLTGLLLSVVLIYGLLIHFLNLILWLRKTEKTYLGQMGFSWASFIAMVMSTGIISVYGNGEIVAVFPIIKIRNVCQSVIGNSCSISYNTLANVTYFNYFV